jgi:tetratricopeptide (TPR) repeat protein
MTLVAVVAASMPSTNAFAETNTLTPDQRTKLDELRHKGDDAMDALRADEALEAYSEAFRLSNNPVFLYNRGRALQLLGRFPEALAELEHFAKMASPELRARVPRLNDLIAQVRAKVCVVNIHASVDGARVVIRNQIVGTTPLAEDPRVIAGHATIEISREGYTTFTRALDLPGGGSVVVEANLVSTATAGELTVLADPYDAVITIDQKITGRAPLETVLDAGTHAIAATREGYDSAKSTVVVEIGAKKQITIKLEKTPLLTSKWWFWTGVGIFVVGTGTIIYANLKDKGVPQGTLGNATAPLLKF